MKNESTKCRESCPLIPFDGISEWCRVELVDIQASSNDSKYNTEEFGRHKM